MEVYVLSTSDGYESSSVLGVYQSAYCAVQDALDNMDRLDVAVTVARVVVDEFNTTPVVVFDCYTWQFEADGRQFLNYPA